MAEGTSGDEVTLPEPRGKEEINEVDDDNLHYYTQQGCQID